MADQHLRKAGVERIERHDQIRFAAEDRDCEERVRRLAALGILAPYDHALAIRGPSGGVPVPRAACQGLSSGRVQIANKYAAVTGVSRHISEGVAVRRPGGDRRVVRDDFYGRELVARRACGRVKQPSGDGSQ